MVHALSTRKPDQGHYNFRRVHQTLRVTPAMEAGSADYVWSNDTIVRSSCRTYLMAKDRGINQQGCGDMTIPTRAVLRTVDLVEPLPAPGDDAS